MAQLDLPGLWDRNCGSLSGGQRRRLDIAMGLTHEPGLVFLDEPTPGLDPQARSNLWDHIRSLRDRGATVFLTTHYLDEADALSDRILVIDQGRIIASGTPDQLKQDVSGDLIALSLADADDAEKASEVLGRLPSAAELASDGAHVEVRVSAAGTVVPGMLRELDGLGVELDAVEVRRPTLDDVFLSLTGRSLRDDEEA
jgi:ABC-2 type transport system ATP-binding protein